MIVEDEDLLREATSILFRRKGFKVLEALNGTLALELVLKHKVDVVLSDVRMPGGDGIQLLDAIRSLHPALPIVILVTGYADIPFEAAYRKGADAVFSKPYDRETLMAAIFDALGAKENMRNS